MTRSLKAILVMCAVAVVAPTAQTDPDVSSRGGMVVCTSAPACDAGAAILARGGNAVDAAVATAFAMAVTYPSAGNIGGGGFMIVRAANGSATAFDYRERAPLKSTRTMFLAEGKSTSPSPTRAIWRPACRGRCVASRSRTRSSGRCPGRTS